MDHAGRVELCGSSVVVQRLQMGPSGQVCAKDDAHQSARYAAQLRHLPVPPGRGLGLCQKNMIHRVDSDAGLLLSLLHTSSVCLQMQSSTDHCCLLFTDCNVPLPCDVLLAHVNKATQLSQREAHFAWGDQLAKEEKCRGEGISPEALACP